MTVNRERCLEVVAAAERAEQVKHNQDTFLWSEDLEAKSGREIMDDGPVPLSRFQEGACNTSACLAGFAALRYAPKGTTFDVARVRLYLPGQVEGEPIDVWARDALGLSPEQADSVFFCFEDDVAIARLRHLADNPDTEAHDLANMFPTDDADADW